MFICLDTRKTKAKKSPPFLKTFWIKPDRSLKNTGLGQISVEDNQNIRFRLFTKELCGLASEFEVDPSSCGNPEHYREYLLFRALADNVSGWSTTHVMLSEDLKQIAGFITLKASAVLSEIDNKLFAGEPAIEVYNLAVAKSFQKQGIGRELVLLSIAMAQEANDLHFGVRNLVLTADPKAVGFYEKCEFVSLSKYYMLPKDLENASCVPMILKLRT